MWGTGAYFCRIVAVCTHIHTYIYIYYSGSVSVLFGTGRRSRCCLLCTPALTLPSTSSQPPPPPPPRRHHPTPSSVATTEAAASSPSVRSGADGARAPECQTTARRGHARARKSETFTARSRSCICHGVVHPFFLNVFPVRWTTTTRPVSTRSSSKTAVVYGNRRERARARRRCRILHVRVVHAVFRNPFVRKNQCGASRLGMTAVEIMAVFKTSCPAYEGKDAVRILLFIIYCTDTRFVFDLFVLIHVTVHTRASYNTSHYLYDAFVVRLQLHNVIICTH